MSQQKDKAIQAAIDRLHSDTKKAEETLYQEAIEKLSTITTKDGVIENNDDNLAVAINLGIFTDRTDEDMLALAAGIAQSLKAIQKLSVEYFNELGIDADIEDAAFLDDAFGFSDEGLEDGGFLFSIASIEPVKDRLKYLVLAGVMSGRVLPDLIADVQLFVLGDGGLGAIGAHLRSYNADDFFKQALTITDKFFADKNGLDKFIYAGGLVERSRDFCIQRDGLEFWRYQGEEWNDLDWAGKIEGIDFFVQVGGFNCRHYLEWFRSK